MEDTLHEDLQSWVETVQSILEGKSPMVYRELTPQEEIEFRDYAQVNDPPSIDDWEIYHPVCREVWMERGIYPYK